LLQVGTVQLQHRTPQGFSQTLPAPPDQPVKVSLHDCLACSGCVTSAETVLLQHQSAGELLQRLRDPAWTVVVSLSPQSVAALAALYGLATADCAGRLAAALRSLGATAVLDTSCSRQLALAEAAAEFLQRYRSSARGAAALAAAGPAAAAAAGQADAMDVDGDVPLHPPSGSSGAGDAGPLPMLASACPGWVCYAEKTHGDHALPHIATGEPLLAAVRACRSRLEPPLLHTAVGIVQLASGQHACDWDACLPLHTSNLSLRKDGRRRTTGL
jgi:iron only hydrogenase large subunit-like protein